MSSFLQQSLKAERERRNGNDNKKILALRSLLAPKQLEIVDDPHRFKIAACSRRAGKTFGVAAYLIIECLRTSNTPTLYLGLTRDSAKEAVWFTLLGMLESLDIAHEARPSALQIRFPNGSTISLFGGDVPNARNRLRGRKFKLVAADETGFFLDLDPLMFAILPTLADLQGTLLMTSSPGERLSGFFYEAFAGAQRGSWHQYHWLMTDNPLFMKPATEPGYRNLAEQELDLICKLQFGGLRDHPAFQREYLGRYVRDDSKLVYPYKLTCVLSVSTALPKERFALGIDLGVSSESAVVVLKYSEYAREVQIVETWSEANVLVDDLAGVVNNFREKYDPTIIVADTGGLGSAFVQELRRRYSIPIRAADKMDKSAYQRIFANDLISGYIKVVKGLKIIEEWDTIIRDIDGAEKRGQKNHEADAALYVYRYIYQMHLKHFEPLKTVDQQVDEWVEQFADRAQAEEREAKEDRSYEY